MTDTFAHGPTPGGVTSFQVTPLSAVTWISPSSVPTQMRLMSWYDGATV